MAKWLGDDGSDLVGIGSDSDLDLEPQIDTDADFGSDLDLVLACMTLGSAKTDFVLPKHWNPDVEADHMMFEPGKVQVQEEGDDQVESGSVGWKAVWTPLAAGSLKVVHRPWGM